MAHGFEGTDLNIRGVGVTILRGKYTPHGHHFAGLNSALLQKLDVIVRRQTEP